MPKKNILQDIKPISRKTTKVSVPVPAKKPVVHKETEASRSFDLPFEPADIKHSPKYALWYIAVACIIGFLFSLSFLFEHATVTITPKSLPVSFDSTDSFTAQKDSTNPSVVSYTQMTLSGDESIKLPGTESKITAMPATGRVILYNTYSAKPYKIIKNSRLATSDKRIYRIDNAVTIPGYTKSGTTITPGTIEVNVTSVTTGESGNLDQGDFTLPAFAGTPQFTKIYGRTKTSISGGISGTVYSIPQDVANSALGTLQDKLKATLISKAKVQIPDGYIFYDGATAFSTDNSVQAPYSSDKEIPLALHGTLTAYLLKQNTLEGAIAVKSVSQYNNEPITIPKISSLILSPIGNLQPSTDTSFSFSLSGEANITWIINPDDIKKLVAGRKKSEFQSLLSGIVGIDHAEVVMKPFWKQSFPEDPTRIEVVISKP